MWIMLTKKPPVQYGPPKLSFHWSVPWVDEKIAEEQFMRWLKIESPGVLWGGDGRRRGIKRLKEQMAKFRRRDEEEYLKKWEEFKNLKIVPDPVFGKQEHNSAGARAILFQGEQIRVFPDEFNDKPAMEFYIEEDALILHPANTSASDEEPFTDEEKVLYEHALVDGCSKFQAIQVAFGKEYNDIQFPPIGWYEIRPELGSYYCREEELKWEKKQA